MQHPKFPRDTPLSLPFSLVRSCNPLPAPISQWPLRPMSRNTGVLEKNNISYYIIYFSLAEASFINLKEYKENHENLKKRKKTSTFHSNMFLAFNLICKVFSISIKLQKNNFSPYNAILEPLTMSSSPNLSLTKLFR